MSNRPWSFASGDVVRAWSRRRFAATASRRRQQEEEEKKKGGGWTDRVSGFVDALTPEFAEAPAKAVGKGALKGLELLDLPADVTLRPLMGALTYLGAEEVTDPETGRKYRKSPSFGDLLKGWKELATQDPIESWREGRSAFHERMANPELNAASRFFLGAASDPLTYVGPGAVKGGARLLGGRRVAQAVAGESRAARLARSLIENESRTQSLGMLAGGTAGAGVAEKVGAPAPELTGGIVGALGGAIAAPRYGSIRGLRRVGEDIARAQGRPGREPVFGLQTENVGPRTTVREGDKVYEFDYEIVDLAKPDQVKASHDPFDFQPTAGYDPHLQPRARSDPASQQQVRRIAAELDVDKMLAETHDLQHGTPIIGPDGMVESGNGRIMALQYAAREHPNRFAEYTHEVARRAERIGLDPSGIENMEAPALVRRRVTPLEGNARTRFVAQANANPMEQMGPVEVANLDARFFTPAELADIDPAPGQTLDDWLSTRRGNDWARRFLGDLNPNELKEVTEAKNGRLNAAGRQRLKAALFARIFPGDAGERLIRNAFETADPVARNAVHSIENVLGLLARLEGGIEAGNVHEALSFAKDLGDAADVFVRLRRNELPFATVEDALDQTGLFGQGYDLALSPLSRSILRGMGDYTRSSTKLTELLRTYLNAALDQPPPNQTSMFGDIPRPDSLTLWESVTGRPQEHVPPSQPGTEGARPEEPVRPESEAPPPPGPKAASAEPGQALEPTTRAEEPRGETPGAEEPPPAREAPGPEEPPPAKEAPPPETEPETPGGEFAQAEQAAEPPPPLDTSNAYTTLGLEAGSYDSRAIRNAYRAQARRYHPDVNSSASATEDMKAINRAFDSLAGEAAVHGQTSGTPRSTSKNAYRSRRSRYNQEQRTRADSERAWRKKWEQEQRDKFRRYKEDRAGAEARTEEEIRGRRPEGEPERVDIANGEGRTVEQLRADAPLGYRLVVPDEGAPYYRRVITNDTIRELRRHPQPPPVTPVSSREWFAGVESPEDVADRWYEASIRWHPRFAGPTATLRDDYNAMRKAARSAFYRTFQNQMMAEMGIDASDLRSMSRDAKIRFARAISAAGNEMMKEIEAQVLREEWYEPLRSSMGKGFESSSEYGMTGEGVTPDSIAGEPPLEGGPPPETPPPPTGRGGTQEFGAKAPYDLFHTPTRETLLRRGSKDSLLQKLGDKLRKVLLRADPDTADIKARRKVDPFIKEHRRRMHNATHIVQADADLTRAMLQDAGMELRLVNDELRLFADGTDVGYFYDVMEHPTTSGKEGYQQLNAKQRSVADYIENSNRLFNETKQANGAKVLIDPNIEGAYFGRRAIGRAYEAEGGPKYVGGEEAFGVSRRVGATRTKSRVFESYKEFVDAGFKADDPWTARMAVQRAKLLDADDAWLKRNLEPLRVNKEPLRSGVGFEEIGHPAFNGQLYEPKIARIIRAGLEPKKPAIPILAEINRVLTPLRASFDFSATFQQGLRLWTSNPRAAAQYWWEVTRSLKDESVYQGALLKMDQRARAAGLENGLTDLISYGNRYTGAGVGTEFTLPSDVLEKWGKTKVGRLPAKGFEISNAHFDRTLNMYRLHMALNQAERLRALDLTPAEFDEAMKTSARAGNRAFGWTETETSGLEDSLIFAPRYTRAAVETLHKAITDGGFEGVAARRHMALMLSEGAGLVWLYNTLRGHETTWDPTDPNFLRFRDVAGLDVSPFGTYNTLFRAVAQVIAGDDPRKALSERRPTLKPIKRFAEGKLSPAMALAWWPIRGETYLGEPLDWDSPEAATKSLNELSASFLPFTVQTATQEGPLSAGVSAFGLSNTPVTPTEHRNWRRDVVAQESYGKSYDDLSGAEKAKVNRDEEVAQHQAEADRNALTRKGDRSAQVKATTEAASKLDALGSELEAKKISGNDFRDQYRIIQAELRGARDAIDARPGGDKVLSGWFDLYDAAERPTGEIDYDVLEPLQEQYRQEHPDVEDRLLRAIGAHDNPAVQRYREAQKVASEYYKLPAYRGMSLADSRTATEILMSAQDRVSFGQARNIKHALRLIAARDPQGVKLARRALRVGPNPERRRFRRGNELLAEFYSDI